MTSKTIVLRVLDGVIAAAIGVLMLSLAGLSTDWLSGLLDMSPREFLGFSVFVVFAALWLMHEIGTSDSAP